MLRLNENFAKLPGSYLFAEVSRRAGEYAQSHPDRRLIKLGIGDVTLPLPGACVDAMKKAAEEQGSAGTFRGYGPYEGYEFLRRAIAVGEYALVGADISPDEIFVSDGAKGDCAAIGDIFSEDCVVAVCDPVYPVYVDASAMSGRAGDWYGERWTRIVYMPCTAENGFIPELPETVPDLIYLCFPNNPTGMTATRSELKRWVDYANEHGSVILYDSAYRAFIADSSLPRSIYEIDGARTCAIEFGSFSKSAGFTGTRCGWTVVPGDLKRGGVSLRDIWARRLSTKYNGTSYIIQRGAEAVYTPEGQKSCAENIAYYMKNARVIRAGLRLAGLEVYGGENSPYVWFRAPGGMDSWSFFDLLLRDANVVTTPGEGFGPSGAGFIRVTAFGKAEDTVEAVRRIISVL